MSDVFQIARMGWDRPGRHRGRVKWDKAALWFRLRYPDIEQIQRALNLLSRHTDRLGFRLRPENGVTRLYIGVATDAVATVLQEMAQDMGFRLTDAEDLPPAMRGRFGPSQELLTDEAAGEGVDAYLVHEHLFTLSSSKHNRTFPRPVALNGYGGNRSGEWRMPEPLFGITTRPKWPETMPSELTLFDEDDWVLGQTLDGARSGGRRVQLFGTDDSTAEWLSRLALVRASVKPAGLVVIDGQGDLIPRLLSNPLIAHLRSVRQATYLDVTVAGQGGVNPLSAESGEDPEEVMERWRWWFSGMGVIDQALELLPLASEAGISDLTNLHNWLQGRTGANFAAAASFRAILGQLERSQVVHRWFTLNPISLASATAEGVLLISCPNKGNWARIQAIRAAIGLATRHGVAFLLHQTSLSDKDVDKNKLLRIVINNKAQNPATTTDTFILTRHDSTVREEILESLQDTKIFPATADEHVRCLRAGEALIVRNGRVAWCSLNRELSKA